MSVAYLDIEGTPEDCVEVGIVIANSNRELLAAACFHAPPNNEDKFNNESKFCHGMKLKNLKFCCNKENTSSQTELHKKVIDFLQNYNIDMIVGNDGADSDNVKFLKIAGYNNFRYLNSSLPCWIERDQQIYHTKALFYKKHHIAVAGTFCRAFHNPDICVTKGSLGTVNAKCRAGGHCAMYDALEVFLYCGGELGPQEELDALYFVTHL